MKNNLKYMACAILLIAVNFYYAPAFAQRMVRKGPAPAQEISDARAAVLADMDNLKAHRTYIYALNLDNPLLVPQYKAWMKQYPKNITIPLSIGTIFHGAEMPEAKDFLLRAAEIDPQNAKIWYMLSGDAFNSGQTALSTEYMKKATLIDPSDANYAFHYLSTFKAGNANDYKQQVFDFAKRFPTSEQGAQALYWLGEDAKNMNDKISYLEDLRKLYPPKKFNWSSSGMTGLADAYLQTDPEKALVLINEMGDEKDWQMRKQVAESLIKVDKLSQAQNYNDAVTMLNQVQLPRFNYIDEFILLKKASLQQKAGNVKAAYDSLAQKFATSPTDRLYAALELYGKATGKDTEQIATDIETIRYSKAVAAAPFNLGLYSSKDSLSLKKLKGKVVLLTFWFPGCGPCRAEFPDFDAVIKKFKPADVAFIGINVTPEQDPYVLPLMKNGRYSFIPLRGNAEFALKNYQVQGEPENFLIDQDGKIIFKDFRIDNTNRRTLELMISSLLQKSARGN
jgi:thiol-disulfide isomerase/thioredoxin